MTNEKPYLLKETHHGYQEHQGLDLEILEKDNRKLESEWSELSYLFSKETLQILRETVGKEKSNIFTETDGS